MLKSFFNVVNSSFFCIFTCFESNHSLLKYWDVHICLDWCDMFYFVSYKYYTTILWSLHCLAMYIVYSNAHNSVHYISGNNYFKTFLGTYVTFWEVTVYLD